MLQQPFGWVTTQQLRLQQRSKRLCQGNHSKRCSAELQGWKSNTNGTDLWNMLQQSFGWVTSTGYTSKGGVNTLFPVVVGEFGSSYVDELVRAPPSHALLALLKHCVEPPISVSHAHEALVRSSSSFA